MYPITLVSMPCLYIVYTDMVKKGWRFSQYIGNLLTLGHPTVVHPYSSSSLYPLYFPLFDDRGKQVPPFIPKRKMIKNFLSTIFLFFEDGLDSIGRMVAQSWRWWWIQSLLLDHLSLRMDRIGLDRKDGHLSLRMDWIRWEGC